MRVAGPFAFAALIYVVGFSTAVNGKAAQRAGVFNESLNHPAIKYNTTDANTAVDELNRKIASGAATLVYDEKSGFLKSALEFLKIPVESQVMVYSQTSMQAERILPDNPRAIYFNDEVSVGYVRGGGILEVVAQDAKLGSVFYVIHQERASKNFARETQCLRCHLSWDTVGVPGLSVLTTLPRKTKYDYAEGGFVDHFRPISERWGGWYVTGTRVPARHMGNFPLFMPERLDTPPPAKASLEGQFDLTSYPTPYSDIAALMVLEHQVHATNLITRANWEARIPGQPRLIDAVDRLVDYLMFVDEAPIPAGGIEGSSGFAKVFEAAGPRDTRGRSLRELDLKTRLMKYPLSYMIYSPSFAALPPAAKELTFDRLRQRLPDEIQEILKQTNVLLR